MKVAAPPLQKSSPDQRNRGRLSRRALLRTGLVVTLGVAASVFAINLYKSVSLRNCFLPELQRRYFADRYNSRLLATLGLRLGDAGRYRDAANAFGDAIAAGEDQRDLWLAWAASAAASGDRIRAYNILMVAAQNAPKDGQTGISAMETFTSRRLSLR